MHKRVCVTPYWVGAPTRPRGVAACPRVCPRLQLHLQPYDNREHDIQNRDYKSTRIAAVTKSVSTSTPSACAVTRSDSCGTAWRDASRSYHCG